MTAELLDAQALIDTDMVSPLAWAENGQSLSFSCQLGYLTASFGKYNDPAEFRIEYVKVHVHRQSIGRALLTLGMMKAQEKGARLITADIISRESFENMRQVFGEDSLQVVQLGEYNFPAITHTLNKPKRTKAFLNYALPSTD